MKKRLILTAILMLLACVGAFALTEADYTEFGPYTHQVFDTENDAGTLTVRYIETYSYMKNGEKVLAGDCTVFISPEGLVMVIDCSSQPCFEELDKQFQMMGIEKIDIFVMSHPHSDHIGAFTQIAAKYPVSKVYKNSVNYTSGTYANAMNDIKTRNIPYEILYAGDEFMFGEYITVKCYAPTPEKTEGKENAEAGDMNGTSLALKITYGDSSFWSSGDLYVKEEQDLMTTYTAEELSADIMKMNHHGKSTSNLKDFIKYIAPKVAIGMYDLIEDKTVAQRYKYLCKVDQVFYTCSDGSVRVRTTGDGTYDIQTSRIRTIKWYGDISEDGHYVID